MVWDTQKRYPFNSAEEFVVFPIVSNNQSLANELAVDVHLT